MHSFFKMLENVDQDDDFYLFKTTYRSLINKTIKSLEDNRVEKQVLMKKLGPVVDDIDRKVDVVYTEGFSDPVFIGPGCSDSNAFKLESLISSVIRGYKPDLDVKEGRFIQDMVQKSDFKDPADVLENQTQMPARFETEDNIFRASIRYEKMSPSLYVCYEWVSSDFLDNTPESFRTASVDEIL